MHTLIVYESMYGNTHAIAEHIGAGLQAAGSVEVVATEEATAERVAAADLLIVGGPTHVHGLTSARSRQAAIDAAAKPESELELDPDAEGPGLRDWLSALGQLDGKQAAAFDTRMAGPAAFTGRASRGIAKRLRHHGARLVADPESFLVDKQNHLEPDEAERAERWSASLAEALQAATASGRSA